MAGCRRPLGGRGLLGLLLVLLGLPITERRWGDSAVYVARRLLLGDF